MPTSAMPPPPGPVGTAPSHESATSSGEGQGSTNRQVGQSSSHATASFSTCISLLAAVMATTYYSTYTWHVGPGGSSPAGVMAAWICADAALRASLITCFLVHELFHTACAAALLLLPGLACGAPNNLEGVLTRDNLLGHVPADEWAALLLPPWAAKALPAGWVPSAHHRPTRRRSAGPSPHVTVEVAVEGRCSPGFDRAVRRAGAVGSAVLALATPLLLPAAPPHGYCWAAARAAAVAGAWLVLAGAMATDLAGRPDQRPGVYCCGNFGVLLALLTEAQQMMADYAPIVMQRMCEVTQVRGGQAAGIASVVMTTGKKDDDSRHGGAGGARFRGAPHLEAAEPTPTHSGSVSSSRHRMVSGKRSNMPLELRKGYAKEAGAAYPASATSAAFIGHTRFATTSLPELNETHPHVWTPFREEPVWILQPGGRFKKESKLVGVYLSHNGDFDLYSIFGRDVTCGNFGMWLERVLDMPNTTKGDSAKIAGCLELLRCQGQWDKAVRYAYQFKVASSIQDATGGLPPAKDAPWSAPPREWLHRWAKILDQVFEEYQDELIEPLGGGRWRSRRRISPFVIRILEHLTTVGDEERKYLGASKAREALVFLEGILSSAGGGSSRDISRVDGNAYPGRQGLHNRSASSSLDVSRSGGNAYPGGNFIPTPPKPSAPPAPSPPDPQGEFASLMPGGGEVGEVGDEGPALSPLVVETAANSAYGYSSPAQASPAAGSPAAPAPPVANGHGEDGGGSPAAEEPSPAPPPAAGPAPPASPRAASPAPRPAALSIEKQLPPQGGRLSPALRGGVPYSPLADSPRASSSAGSVGGSGRGVAAAATASPADAAAAAVARAEAGGAPIPRRPSAAASTGSRKMFARQPSIMDDDKRGDVMSMAQPLARQLGESGGNRPLYVNTRESELQEEDDLRGLASDSPRAKEPKGLKKGSQGTFRRLTGMIPTLDSASAPMAGQSGSGGKGAAGPRRAGTTFEATQLGGQKLVRFLRVVCSSFMHNDMYESTRMFLGKATGSFGLTAVSTLEPGTTIVAAWGQQMTIALDQTKRMALYGSEVSAMKVPVKTGRDTSDGSKESDEEKARRFMSHRLDLDETHGEVVRLAMGERPVLDDGSSTNPSSVMWKGGLALRSYRFSMVRELHDKELLPRLVPLLGNPLVQALPVLSPSDAADPVGADIRAIPSVLADIRDSWQQVGGPNRETALHFAHMIFEKCEVNQRRTVRNVWEGRDLDLLIVGVETSLWLAEQWASDLLKVMPRVQLKVVSANKVLQLLGSKMPGEIQNTGFNITRASLQLDKAIVLVVSQSGQTFPVLHASRLLRTLVGNRLFVMTGEFDSKLGLVVGQDYTKPDVFCSRIFSNLSGWRPAEPSTVAAAAAHATLTELLMFMLYIYSRELGPKCFSVFGMTMAFRDIQNLAEMRNVLVDAHAPAICLGGEAAVSAAESGPGKGGGSSSSKVAPAPSGGDDDFRKGALADVAGGTHGELVAQGERWAHHVLEGWRSLVFAAAYVLLTVTFQVTPFGLAARAIGCAGDFWAQDDAWRIAVGFVLRILDSALYIWVGYLFTLAYRAGRGADVWARTGKRTIVICDVPYVHQMLEVYVSKLFAMSWGHVGIDVHGANPVDHLVHRFTHRVSRGVLLAMGRPDGRVCSLAKLDQAVMLAAMQAAAIQNLKTGPEIVTVGHNTYQGVAEAVRKHVVLPCQRRRFVCEYTLSKMSATATEDPQQVLAELGGKIVMPRETMTLMSQEGIPCDRCHKAQKTSRVECLTCRMVSCKVCDAVVHGLMGKNSGHRRLGARAVACMRLRAREARLAVFVRNLEYSRKAQGKGPGGAGLSRTLSHSMSTKRRSLTASMSSKGMVMRDRNLDLSSHGGFSGEGGNSLIMSKGQFGDAAARDILEPPSAVLRARDAPIGEHHCRAFHASLTSRRARNRWKKAVVLVTIHAKPWQNLALRLQAAGLMNLSVLKNTADLFSAVDESAKSVLAFEETLEGLSESRFGSFERYLAFLVMFHAMARRVSRGMWVLPSFDVSRTQSILRVASTAAPVSGAEVSEVLRAARAPAWLTDKRGMHFAHVADRDARTTSF